MAGNKGHEVGFCGNHGCTKCYPRKDKPHVAARKLRIAREALEATQRAKGIHPFPLQRPKEGPSTE